MHTRHVSSARAYIQEKHAPINLTQKVSKLKKEKRKGKRIRAQVRARIKVQPREETKAQSGTKVTAQLEKGQKLSLGQTGLSSGQWAWHVEDSQVASLLCCTDLS